MMLNLAARISPRMALCKAQDAALRIDKAQIAAGEVSFGQRA
jgi:hypothetical protein